MFNGDECAPSGSEWMHRLGLRQKYRSIVTKLQMLATEGYGVALIVSSGGLLARRKVEKHHIDGVRERTVIL